MTLLCLIAPDTSPTYDADLVTQAAIQLIGSGGLGTLLLFLWTTLKTKLDDINKADVDLGVRIDRLDSDIDVRFNALQAEIARKASAESLAALEGRVIAVEREGRERSRRLNRVEARSELSSASASGVLPRVQDDVPTRER